jgi:hypothetical protein
MPKVAARTHRKRVKERASHRGNQAFHKDAGYVQDTYNRVPEPVKRAVAIAYRAWGLDQKLHQQGFIMRGDVVRGTIERILSLESEPYQGFVVDSIVETADILKRMLDKQGYDSGYYPLTETRRGQREYNH